MGSTFPDTKPTSLEEESDSRKVYVSRFHRQCGLLSIASARISCALLFAPFALSQRANQSLVPGSSSQRDTLFAFTIATDASPFTGGLPYPVSNSTPGGAVAASAVPAMRRIETTVEVDAGEQALRTGMVEPYHATQAEALSSAGTYGDFSRYLQTVPGVVWNVSDHQKT
jgi:hypothetical protein